MEASSLSRWTAFAVNACVNCNYIFHFACLSCRSVVQWRSTHHTSLYFPGFHMEKARCWIRHFMRRKSRGYACPLSSRYIYIFALLCYSLIGITSCYHSCTPGNSKLFSIHGAIFWQVLYGPCSSTTLFSLLTSGSVSKRSGTWCGSLNVSLRTRSPGSMTVSCSSSENPHHYIRRKCLLWWWHNRLPIINLGLIIMPIPSC